MNCILTRQIKIRITIFTFFLSETLYSVLAAKCYWHFCVNKFKTLYKTNKINTILCRLNFNLLSLCLSEKWTNSEYIAGVGGCGIKPKKTVPCRSLHHRSDFIYHVKRDDWQEEWGERQDDGGRVSKRNVKAPVLSPLTSESDINPSQNLESFQMTNSPKSTYQVKSK